MKLKHYFHNYYLIEIETIQHYIDRNKMMHPKSNQIGTADCGFKTKFP